MSPALAVAAAFASGSVISGVLVVALTRSRLCPNPEDHDLRDDEREEVASEFAAHATSVRRELGRYADALADGDTDLRKRLRQIEAGVAS
ncbi:hypothetical protein [Mycobacterium sp. 1245852.3]|uniref:hypothetical protein n=1 Tax=Mycobacterium sp. 1245852.3 TaxID=1856860 RepID=UPI0007FD4E16|nr:hypothetical protein [Mycobacterium sp. 1245852.3]OBK19139.1 hypothetical protein A9W96_05925 [Mycobacterium sp. 1245852.3]